MHGIVVEDRDLVIGTHGRGFYVLDNIGVLRQATPEITSTNLHVFTTFNPLRGRDRNVAIDYYLGKAADEVKIEFLDAGGTVTARLHRRHRKPSPLPPPRAEATTTSSAAPSRAWASRRA